jgi:hypothetical protein
MKISSFLKLVLLAGVFSCLSKVHAQDMDFLKHRKVFDICSIKKNCEHCFSCDQLRYIVKVNNKQDKKITHVYYKFYSPVFNKVLEKEAKVVGDKIGAKEIGQFYVCVFNVRHWIVSKIEYGDGSTTTFMLKDRLDNFFQEADECDCND